MAPVTGRLGGAARLPVSVLGLRFPNPLILAAGFDKNAEHLDGLFALGFGAVEIGSVTARPQPGNPRPRLFRLAADRALVNRMGFNNDGADVIAARLARWRRHGRFSDAIVGVNIGRSKDAPAGAAAADYAASARLLAPHADYMVVNVSSPNTPGLRDLQATAALRPVLESVRVAAGDAGRRELPVLVKVAPDLAGDDVDAITDLALELDLAGIIATNTTVARDRLSSTAATVDAAGAGGLSGRPLAPAALATLERIVTRADGRLTVVAAGGIDGAEAARARLAAGADLLQAYTGFVYGGPRWPRALIAELAT